MGLAITVGSLILPMVVDASASTTDWHEQPIAEPATAYDSGLSAIACSAADACTAVGNYVTKSYAYLAEAERWNGDAWKVETTPDPTGGSYVGLDAVACPSATSCFAVGSYDNSAHDSTAVLEHWNGASWKLQTVPRPAGTTTSGLEGISCRSASFCEIVGDYSTKSGASSTLAESWNGTSWKVQATPNPSGSAYNVLDAVSCPSTTACVAVGRKTGSQDEVLAETWNAKNWTIRSTPAVTNAAGGSLSGVSCTSTDACTAVGSYLTSNYDYFNLAERWNGAAWKVQTTPNSLPGTTGKSGVRNILAGISCSSATACTATGVADTTAATAQTVAEAWNGSAWSLQTTVSPAQGASQLDGVACTTTVHCTAVGDYTAAQTGVFTNLVEVRQS